MASLAAMGIGRAVVQCRPLAASAQRTHHMAFRSTRCMVSHLNAAMLIMLVPDIWSCSWELTTCMHDQVVQSRPARLFVATRAHLVASCAAFLVQQSAIELDHVSCLHAAPVDSCRRQRRPQTSQRSTPRHRSTTCCNTACALLCASCAAAALTAAEVLLLCACRNRSYNLQNMANMPDVARMQFPVRSRRDGEAGSPQGWPPGRHQGVGERADPSSPCRARPWLAGFSSTLHHALDTCARVASCSVFQQDSDVLSLLACRTKRGSSFWRAL